MQPDLSVIVPTHNPDASRLARTLAALRAQTLPAERWETLLVDNLSDPPLTASALAGPAPSGLRFLREERLGLTAARRRGFGEARGEVLVLVDDDNVLAPDYLARVADRFASDPGLGAAGGRSLPEFEAAPPAWAREFDGLLALRDLGDQPQRAAWRGPQARAYPLCSPIGGGMALRRAGAESYGRALDRDSAAGDFDRRGADLNSGGDNDLVMTILEAGFAVAYFPDLLLTHLIPARRHQRNYLGALNRAIARSWVRVLARHGIAPWPPLARRTVRLRQWRAWLRARAWRGPAEWVRWQGLCGAFEGQADLLSAPAGRVPSRRPPP